MTLCVDSVLSRLKKLVGVYSDAELARSLGLTASNVSSWRRRNALPYKKCVQIAAEQNISLDWLLFGKEEFSSDEADVATAQPTSDQVLVRNQSSGFSDLPKEGRRRSADQKTVHPDQRGPDHVSMLQDSEKSASAQTYVPILVDGSRRAQADLLRNSLRELLLMLHDAGTIDLRGADAEAITDAFMGAVHRSMKEAANPGPIISESDTAP